MARMPFCALACHGVPPAISRKTGFRRFRNTQFPDEPEIRTALGLPIAAASRPRGSCNWQRMKKSSETEAMSGRARATLDDLYRTPEKAELIGGRIVRFMATGHQPILVA